MNNEIIDYIESNFTQELASEIQTSFNIIYSYEYDGLEQKIIELLANGSYMDYDTLKDNIYQEILNSLYFIIKEHKIKLIDEATLTEINDFLKALLLLQQQEDYQPIIIALESDDEDIDKLADVISIVSNFTKDDVLRLVEDFDTTILNTLKIYIYNKENNINTNTSNKSIIDNLTLFVAFIKNDFTSSITSSIQLEATIDIYLNYFIDDILESDNDQAAIIILTLLYMSEDSYNRPLEQYRNISSVIYNDLIKINKIETILISTINKFNEYKEIENAKNRLS